MIINKKTTVSRDPEHVHGILDGEVVMMNITTGKYYNLNGTGSMIWDLLKDRTITLEALADELISHYNVDKEACLIDIIDFVENVKDKKVLLIK